MRKGVREIDRTIGIVGAGVTGLSAARALRALGNSVVVFDKGRTIGGRVATRISRSGHQFDHGAQYINPKSQAFQAVLSGAVTTSCAAEWTLEPGKTRFVGAPTMADFPAHLARAVCVRQNVEVLALVKTSKGWLIRTTEGDTEVERLIVTVPAQQATRLLEGHDVVEPLAAVEVAPCLTLMAAFSDGPEPPYAARQSRDKALSWVAHEGSKPGRSQGHRFVAQANEAFSRANLEASKPEIAEMLMPLLTEEIGCSAKDAVYVAGHRWRYARTITPLGQPFLSDPDQTLFVGGDWCLGARVESAWESGNAIVEAIVAGS